jgi:hypothetical protein
MKTNILSLAVTFILAFACAPVMHAQTSLPKYVPDSNELHDTITRMDSLFFDAYNTCKLDVMEAIIADDIEFYHDRGGLTTSKKELLLSLKDNVCGKVSRELLKGSIEVYPIPGYGAVQMAAHRFHNNQEPPNTSSHYSKFVPWHKVGGQWKLERVISLH